MQRRTEEALPEPPWTGKEEEAAWRGDKAEDIFRLVDIEKIPLPEIPEAEPVGNQVFHIIDIIIHHRPLYLIRSRWPFPTVLHCIFFRILLFPA